MTTRVCVTGMGAVTGCGVGCDALERAIRHGESAVVSAVEEMGLPGACAALACFDFEAAVAGYPEPFARRARRAARRAPLSVRAAVVATLEASVQAGVTHTDTSVFVAGHNLNMGYGDEVRAAHAERPDNITPRYALHFLDTDHVGVISEVLASRAVGMTVGGASASGNVGLYQGMNHVRAGRGRCLVVGALMDLSPTELRAFRSVGALADAEDDACLPALLCRPFDQARRGFVYGQGAACLMLESLHDAQQRGARIWGELAGTAVTVDGNRNADPSSEGQVRTMRAALAQAEVAPTEVDYVNAHATASRLGDEVELDALATVLLGHRPWINSTKAITGHCLTAAGVVEAVATLLQMQGGFVHGNPNLEWPLRDDLRLAPRATSDADIRVALSNSFGFGGINTSVVFVRSKL